MPQISKARIIDASGRGPAVFSSVDSVPQSYARKISRWKAPAVLLLFAALSAAQIVILRRCPCQFIFQDGDYVIPGLYPGTHAVAFRVFILSFLISFCLFWAGSWRRRIGITLYSAYLYLLLCVVMDGVTYVMVVVTGYRFSLNMAEVLSGMVGFIVYSLVLLENGALPPAVLIRQRGGWAYTAQFFRVVGFLVLSATIAIFIERSIPLVAVFFRDISLLGGIGPGVFLIVPLFFTITYSVARLQRRFLRRTDFSPDVSVIIPAFNEEYIIQRTIEALDASSEGYGGRVIVMVIDNNSEDRTAEIAASALARCVNIRGRVIHEPLAGKSAALNHGLSEVRTDFVIRVDADTQLQPGTIKTAMNWFGDGRVGVVGGLPLVPGSGRFDRARQIETLVKHGFYSVAMEAFGGVVGVPGMFAVYRTRQLRALGGFVAGMNGEDTDISLRIAERGYRIIVDADATYISEVPVTFDHLREQRLRWFRSVLHISSRSRQIILGFPKSLRGKAILPYMLINSARRSMMVPLVIYGLIELFLGSGLDGLLRWQPVVAVVLGSSVMIAILASLVNKRPRALLGLPDYFLFRFLRAYFTLESMLTIRVMPKRSPFLLGKTT